MIGTENLTDAAAVVAAVEAQVAAPEGDAVREEITGVLDGLQALRKVKSLTDEARALAEAPLREALADAVGKLGVPVARGNTLYVVATGELVVIDLTPKTLVRL